MHTATCPGIQALQSPEANVIASEQGRGRWEQDRGTGAVRRWGDRRDRTGQEGQGGPARRWVSGATRGELPPVRREGVGDAPSSLDRKSVV